MLERDYRVINLRIPVTSVGENEPYKCHLIKKAYFSSSNFTLVAENWNEAFIKYHFPKYALTTSYADNVEEKRFRFLISKSDLLTSSVSVTQHYTGEVRREVFYNITIMDEVLHLGIKSVVTDSYIGSEESNVLEIEPINPIKSLLSFYKFIKPIADLILIITSFAERRRLNWYKCSGLIANRYYHGK